MPAHVHHLVARIRALFRRPSEDQDFDAEMASHLAMLEEEKVRRGMTPEAARRAALLELGAPTQLREAHREARSLPFFETAMQDLRYTVRTLRRDAGFALFSILIAGFGIGACSTIFSVVNTLLLRDLPFREPGRLIWMATQADDGVAEWRIQVDHLLDLRRQSSSFEDLAGYLGDFGNGSRVLTGAGEPERLTAVPVTENFFDVLGIPPLIGRLFNKDECRFNAPPAVLLTHAFWTRRYGADPSIVGRTIQLNDRSATVTGVMPASFDFAAVFAPGSRIDLFSPYPMSPETSRRGNTLAVVGRLKPGVTVESARAESLVIAGQLEQHHPERNAFRPRIRPLNEQVSGRFRLALLVLAGAVGVVMLIVCANLSNLQLARMASRQKEIAIRAAVGAGRGRLIRQMMTESLVLAGCGAIVGLVIALAATRAVAGLETFSIPLLATIKLDSAAFAFTLTLAVLTGITFGLMPALQVRTHTMHDALKESSRGSSEGRKQNWLRGALVVSEIAFACVLLVGAGLLIRSFLQVMHVDLGFRPESLVALRVDPGARYPDQERRNVYYTETLNRVREIPGVTSVGLSDNLPLDGTNSWAIRGKGQFFPSGKYPEGFVHVISEGYLKTAGIALRAGRDFTERDSTAAEPVVLVNETLARTLWPGQNPIGQMMHSEGIFNQVPARRVVGLVGDVRHRAMEQGAGCELYIPLRQLNANSAVQLVVRTTLPISALSSAVSSALKPVQRNLAANNWRMLEQLVDKAVSPRRFVTTLLGGFSLFALMLASLGIYAVVAYSVNQRTQEFGIRMAIGASAGDVRKEVLVQTLRLAGVGITIGATCSWILARGVSSLLYGVTAADPATFAGMVVTLGSVALMAGYLPARRASRIEPMTALRAD
ncbi:MAG TPA: ABC transporter permease [Bryobacteraceae bacterium]|nr:ABC transporter permease [Bryobacteraceae bacterium]